MVRADGKELWKEPLRLDQKYAVEFVELRMFSELEKQIKMADRRDQSNELAVGLFSSAGRFDDVVSQRPHAALCSRGGVIRCR